MNIDWILHSAFPFLAGAAGGAVTLVATAFTKFGDRFIDYILSRRTVVFRHSLDTEIEQLKARLTHLGDRGIRSNELEYAAIIAAWESFVDAYIATNLCALAMVSHADLSRMSEDELTLYLQSTEFSELQRREIIEAHDRNRAYVKTVELRQIATAGRTIFDARSILRKQGIFIPKDLEGNLEQTLSFFSEVQVQRQVEFDYGRTSSLPDKRGDFFRDAPIKFDRIKEQVRSRILLSVASSQLNE